MVQQGRFATMSGWQKLTALGYRCHEAIRLDGQHRGLCFTQYIFRRIAYEQTGNTRSAQCTHHNEVMLRSLANAEMIFAGRPLSSCTLLDPVLSP